MILGDIVVKIDDGEGEHPDRYIINIRVYLRREFRSLIKVQNDKMSPMGGREDVTENIYCSNVTNSPVDTKKHCGNHCFCPYQPLTPTANQCTQGRHRQHL